MNRIAVIGCAGSGTTTVARRLAEFTGGEAIHLDSVYFHGEWDVLPDEEFAAAQEELVAGPQWIISGVYPETLPIRLKAADTVIVLDVAPTMCLWGVLRARLSKAADPYEAYGICGRITGDWLKDVRDHRFTVGPRVLGLIGEHAQHANVYVMNRPRYVEKLIARHTRGRRSPLRIRSSS